LARETHDFVVRTNTITVRVLPVDKTEVATICLLDEEGEPAPDERYLYRLSTGQTGEGRLDDVGVAHIQLPDGASCEITFPDRDAKTWG
jgi:hypothetical protein